jgi:hypothetical protein
MPDSEGIRVGLDPQPPCYACDQPAVGQCRRCGQAFCDLHGGVYCTPCGRHLQQASKRFPASELFRCLGWGALLAFPTLIVGFCGGYTWAGEGDGEVHLGVLLWPIWAAYTLVPVRSMVWLWVGPWIQWVGYALLVGAIRLVFRGLRAAAGGKPGGSVLTNTRGEP